MGKIKLFYLLIGTAALIASCTKPNDNTPANSSPVTLTINPTNASSAPIYGGDSIGFTIVANTSNSLSTATFTQSLNNGTTTQIGSPYTLNGQTTERFTEEYYTPIGFSGTIKLTCTVTDNKGYTDTASAIITVTPDISSYSAVLLASYNDPSGIGSFFSSSNGQVYTVTTAATATNQSLIDMIFFYGASNQYTLASPNDASFGTNSNQISSDGVQNWTIKNNTTFYTTTLTTLSGITYGAQIANALNGGSPYSPSTRANMLAVGNIIAFQTEAGKYGLVQIAQATGGDATAGTGALTINVLVQK